MVVDCEDSYDVEDVIEKMLARKDRRIPESVYKPHNDLVTLIYSNCLGQLK